MTIRDLRRKRVLLPTIAAVAVLGVGGTMWSATASDDVRGAERDRVAQAAVAAVGGTATEVETSDDLGGAYEVEVRTDSGTEVDVVLDRDLTVVSQDAEGSDDPSEERGDDDAAEERGDDGRVLSASERRSAEQAARSAVRGGTVLEVEAADDQGQAYEVEVRGADGTEWDVDLDADFQVLATARDD